MNILSALPVIYVDWLQISLFLFPGLYDILFIHQSVCYSCPSNYILRTREDICGIYIEAHLTFPQTFHVIFVSEKTI